MAPSFLADLLAGLGSAGLAESFLQLLDVCVASALSLTDTARQEQEKKYRLPARGKGAHFGFLKVQP